MDEEYKSIKEEAIRQIEGIHSAASNNDRKLELIFGVSLTIFGYIFSQDTFLGIFTITNYPIIGLFILGLLLITSSVIVGYHAYKLKWMAIGPSTKEMFDALKSGDKRIEETLAYNINNAIESVTGTQEKKWKTTNQSLLLLAIGFITIIVTRLLHFLFI